jgi:hypothetical protein
MPRPSQSFRAAPSQAAQRLGNLPILLIALSLSACVAAPSVSSEGGKKPFPDDSWGDLGTLDQPDFTQPVPVGGPSPTQLGCHGYGECYGLCNTSAVTQADYDTCSAECDSAAAATARSALDATFACGVNACRGAGQCASASDQSDDCLLCAYDAVSAIFGLPCSGDPMCNTSACASQVNACLANLP